VLVNPPLFFKHIHIFFKHILHILRFVILMTDTWRVKRCIIIIIIIIVGYDLVRAVALRFSGVDFCDFALVLSCFVVSVAVLSLCML